MTNQSKTILITGASSGIGKSTAKLFAGEDWNVIATMRNPDDAGDLTQFPNLLVKRLDVKDRESIVQAVDAGIMRFGHIDVVVNNAGYGQYGLFEAIPRDKIQEQFDVNLFGVMDVIRTILPHFRANRGGMIINVSSGAGHYALPMRSLYCASKFALEGFSESLAHELASQNIAVKLVIPYGVVTETSFPERRAKEDAAANAMGDYQAFIEKAQVAFARLNDGQPISAGDVAITILSAASDGASRLRYFIGNDTSGFLKARTELSEDDYISFMRGQFSST